MSKLISYESSAISAGNIMMFFLGLVICIEINFVGTFNLTEIILITLAIYFFFSSNKKIKIKQYNIIFLLAFLWLALQLFTDLYRNTPISDAMKGFANIFIFIINFYSLYNLCFYRIKRIIFFMLGILISQIVDFYFAPNLYVESQPWKFGFGTWINMLVIFLLGSISVQYRSNVKYFLIIAISLFLIGLNFYLGSRALGLIFFLAFMIYLLSEINYRLGFKKLKKMGIKQYILISLASAFSIFLIFNTYSYFANSGALGESAQDKFIVQSSGALGLLLGSRQEILVSSLAVYNSPIIGHGSWAKDSQYSELLKLLLVDFDSQVSAISYEGENYGLIPTHSFLMGAWVYSGIFGAIFWLYIIYLIIRTIAGTTKFKSQYKFLILYVCIAFLWDIMFSPLGLYSRIYASMMLVVVLSGQLKEFSFNKSRSKINS